ncbi:metallopeptidase [Candidatus Gottesmanbacteria bacterium]|nr:metallopeptidase [Candidatus Gottesmanbacteria bacterium]
MEWLEATDVARSIRLIVTRLDLHYIDHKRIVCFRSHGSSSRARARIWSFPKVWQLALKIPPHYVIEVLSQYFDHLSNDDKTRVLIHELLHIPKNFSGSLLPHRGRGQHIDRRNVEKLFQLYKNFL